MATQRAIVTGGAGVVGQELVAQLLQANYAVRVIDRLPRPAGMDPSVEYIEADLVALDPSAYVSFDPTIVFHLAAAFERSEETPEFWLQNAHDNVRASQDVLAGAVRCPNLRRYVFASSYLVYDPDQFLGPEVPSEPFCLSEESLIKPRNACGAAKLLHEKEIALAIEDPATEFTAVSARIYRVYGRSSRDVISRWIRHALNGESVDLYGAESYFDYIHARDVAEGLLRLGRSEATGSVNLGSGASQRVSTMVECISTLVPTFEVHGPNPAEIYEASQADIARLEAETGWRPRISLEAGVAELVDHERSNIERGSVSRRVVPERQGTVVVSSVSRKAPLVRAVRLAMESNLVDGAVIGLDADPAAPAATLCDELWAPGRLSEIRDEQIVEFCREHGVRLLIPTRDGELERFAQLASALQAVGCFVPIGSVDSVNTCVDKLASARVLSAAGISTPQTSTTIDDLDGGRYVVKERFGAGSKGVAVDVDARSATEWAQGLDSPIFQPFVAGQEFSVDCYVDRTGEFVGGVARSRDYLVSGESHRTTTVDRADLVEAARVAVSSAGVRGHAVVQLIDTDGGPVVLEINSRVGGASPAAFAAGLRSIDYMLDEAFGETPPRMVPSAAAIELVRLPADAVTFAAE